MAVQKPAAASSSRSAKLLEYEYGKGHLRVAFFRWVGLLRKHLLQLTLEAAILECRHPHRLFDVGAGPIPAIKLGGDQFGELGRDICHRLLCGAQAASRAEQRANFAESFIRRAVYDGNEQVTR